jgi:hypothetical protein
MDAQVVVYYRTMGEVKVAGFLPRAVACYKKGLLSDYRKGFRRARPRRLGAWPDTSHIPSQYDNLSMKMLSGFTANR